MLPSLHSTRTLLRQAVFSRLVASRLGTTTTLRLPTAQVARYRTYKDKDLPPTVYREPDPDPQIGDYPNLPFEPAQWREPMGWWDAQSRRNYGEPVHDQQELMSIFSTDFYHESVSQALKELGIMFSVVGMIVFIIYKTLPDPPATRKTFPYDGLRIELGGNPDDPRDKLLAARTDEVIKYER